MGINWEIVSSIAGAISSIVAVVALVYVIRQQASLEKQLVSALISDAKTHIQEVNRFLLSNKKYAELLGFDEKELLLFLLLQEAERAYFLRDTGDLNADNWQRLSTQTFPNLINETFIKEYWPKVKTQFNSGFASYVDKLLV